MKILVATNFSQGLYASDFCFTLEAELVFVGEVCDVGLQELVCVEQLCGCSRVFVGFASGSATTTALVVDLPISFYEYVDFLRLGLLRWGYEGSFAESLAFCLVDLANVWEVGSVLGRDFWVFLLRAQVFEEI